MCCTSGLEVLALTLVLPGEEARLERMTGAGRISLGRPGLTEQGARVEEVRLGRRALSGLHAAPFGGELTRRMAPHNAAMPVALASCPGASAFAVERAGCDLIRSPDIVSAAFFRRP